MANCDDDDDFSIYGDVNTPQHPHHHRSYAPPSFKPHAPPPQPQNDTAPPANYPETTPFNPFTNDNTNLFNNSGDQNPRVSLSDSKRKDRDENNLSDGAAASSYGYKRTTPSKPPEYRKDREEWSDAAIAALLEAYTEKFNQLNRGNLRGRDWEEVAAAVSDNKQTKSVEQCKNKVDNLKKRYKLERHRMSSGGITGSHWPWFKHLEEIVGNSVSVKSSGGSGEEDKGGSSGSGSAARQSKRYAMTVHNSSSQMNNIKSRSMSNPRWRRVVFKVSGAALVGTGPNNIDPEVTMLIAREVAIACRLGVEVAIVVGGRNFFCGDTWVNTTGLDRSTAYQIGMMATVMNSVLLQSALEKSGVQTRLQSAVSMQQVAEPYNRQRAIRHLEKRRVVIFGGIGAGTGNPLFSTDTAAALQASEINAEAVLKGTNVDGVYDCNSANTNATYEHITFRELASRGGATPMDMMAITYCEENRIPVVVFNLLQPGNISRALCGDPVGTLIDRTGRID